MNFQSPDACERYWTLFEEQGIERPRIVLATLTKSRHEHLNLYNHIDIALDPFPFNGHTTTMEALYMGVPVITLKGQTGFGRVAYSFLTVLELLDLVAETEEEYTDQAVNLTHNISYLKDLKQSLRSRLLNSPLCDSQGYMNAVEQLFKYAWLQYTQSLA